MSGEPTEADRNWKCDSCGIATFVKYSSGNCHVCEIERLRAELAKFRRLSPNGPRDERTAFERDTM